MACDLRGAGRGGCGLPRVRRRGLGVGVARGLRGPAGAVRAAARPTRTGRGRRGLPSFRLRRCGLGVARGPDGTRPGGRHDLGGSRRGRPWPAACAALAGRARPTQLRVRRRGLGVARGQVVGATPTARGKAAGTAPEARVAVQPSVAFTAALMCGFRL